jgi:hypothetical protein
MIQSIIWMKTQNRTMCPNVRWGPQPVAALLEKHKLKPHDLVAASKLQLTHKMVSRACKGRKLSRRVQFKVLYALNEVAEQEYKLRDLFTY